MVGGTIGGRPGGAGGGGDAGGAQTCSVKACSCQMTITSLCLDDTLSIANARTLAAGGAEAKVVVQTRALGPEASAGSLVQRLSLYGANG